MRGTYRTVNPRRHPNRIDSSANDELCLPPITKRPETDQSVTYSFCDDERKSIGVISPKEVITYHRSMLAISTKKSIKQMRGKLLSGLPIYKEKKLLSSGADNTEIKRMGVVLDLKEQGFTESAKFLRKLLDFEIQIRSAPENVADSNKWPWLYKTESLLNVLVSSLREAELARRNGKRLLEVASWFHISVFMALRKNCWHWLADLLFKQCLKVTKVLKTGIKREASIRFTYAQFLFGKLNLQIEALRQFNIVRKMTRKRLFEGLDLFQLDEFSADLHSQSCYFMYKVCLVIAKKIRDKNPSMAVKLSQRAHEFIEVACTGREDRIPSHIDRNSAVIELVLSLMASKEYTTAISKLNTLQVKCRQNFNPKGFCKALYLRAKCYQLMNKRDVAISDLRILCEIAMQCGLSDMSVLAELEYAELLLTLGSTNPLETLRNAAYTFLTSHNDSDRDIRQRARCVIGIAEGLYLWPFYKEMIIASQTNKEELNKLIEWKFCRQPFMKNQIQAFALQIPKRSGQQSSGFVRQIQKFVFPEKLYEILGERLRSAHTYHADSMEKY